MLNSKMKIFKSLAVILCLFVIMSSSPIMALNLFPPSPAVNEEATLLAEVLDVYFESRTYTNVAGIIMAISDITNPGMPEDEAVRMQAWKASNMIGVTNSYEIDQCDTAISSHRYDTTTHTSPHTHQCGKCVREIETVSIIHTLNVVEHSCSVCDYSVHDSPSIYSDTLKHWAVCSICDVTYMEATHLWAAVTDGYECRFCGRFKTSTVLNNLRILRQQVLS